MVGERVLTSDTYIERDPVVARYTYEGSLNSHGTSDDKTYAYPSLKIPRAEFINQFNVEAGSKFLEEKLKDLSVTHEEASTPMLL